MLDWQLQKAGDTMSRMADMELPSTRRKILVVEDNDINRDMLCSLLQDDFDIFEAENGRIGIELLKRHYEELSLILLDVYMPECDGFEFLRFRKRDERYSNIPVIVTTASESLNDEIECLKLGSNDFVVKPYDVEIILNRIYNTIRLRESASIVNQLTWDSVTNLYSAEFFFRRVEDVLKAYPDRPYDIVTSDIKNFKTLNDRYGRKSCDQLLRDLANKLTAVLPDPMAGGRIGGDSFAFLIGHQDSDWTHVLGKTVASNLFPNDDPVGRTLRIGNMPFKVKGVLQMKGVGGMGQDQDDAVLAPYTTVRRVLQASTFPDNVRQLKLSLWSMDQIEEAKSEIGALLRQRHRLSETADDDFRIIDMAEITSTMSGVSNTMTILLAAVAAISLLVGGIGIMNIMLVSVTERIREIGLRMAIGATPANILSQFILEAVLLSTVGGGVGVAIGVTGAQALGEMLGWPILVETGSTVSAFLFSAIVGMFFGFYPAWRASRLNPIDCLRYE